MLRFVRFTFVGIVFLGILALAGLRLHMGLYEERYVAALAEDAGGRDLERALTADAGERQNLLRDAAAAVGRASWSSSALRREVAAFSARTPTSGEIYEPLMQLRGEAVSAWQRQRYPARVTFASVMLFACMIALLCWEPNERRAAC